MKDKVDRAIQLLKENEPPEGYYLAFSGGKDSCVIKELANEAKVKYEAFYSNTTIDPPELIYFIKKHHPDVKWINPKVSMMKRVETKSARPPTRGMRWCCYDYKEKYGDGRIKIIGVRKAESVARKAWTEISEDAHFNKVICPIVDWEDKDVWQYINENGLFYCNLYDEGFTRLGCVGCPLQGYTSQKKEFDRWPKYRANWERAIKKNWEYFHDKISRKGTLYSQSAFKSAEEQWIWWLNEKKPDVNHGECQQMLLWTNENVEDLTMLSIQ